MECDKVRELLSEYVDGILDGERKTLVEEHIQTCTACKEDLASLHALVKKLGSLEHVEAPGDFLRQVHERIERRTGFFETLRSLFVPPRVKISLPFATAAATAVLVLGIYTLMQPEKQVVDAPSVSKGIGMVEKTAADSVAPSPRKESYRAKTLMKEAAAPQGSGAREPVEVVLLIRADREDAAIAADVERERPAPEKKLKPVEEERAAAIDIPKKEMARKASPQGGLRGNWLAEHTQSTPVPAGKEPTEKDKAVTLSSPLDKALSQVTDVIEGVGGKIIAQDHDTRTGRPRSITAEIPTIHFGSFFDRLNQIGILQSPLPAKPAEGQAMVKVRIQLLPSS